MDNEKEKVDAINKMVERMQERSPAPRLTPEQLNAIDLLIFGKTDKEVAETLGIGRNTISKWYKNAFFIAELNLRREALWKDSKLRLKSLVTEAVNVLTNGLHSSDEKIAITAAVHILKTVGLYGEVKQDFGPTSPEEAVWKQAVSKRRDSYLAIRPDAFSDFSIRNRFKAVAEEQTPEVMRFWYDRAVDEQKKELRDFKKKEKAQEEQIQLPQIEPMPLTIEDVEEDLPQAQRSRPEPIKA
jgi:DNA-binding CsgD family transcriptional regulator